MGLTGRPGPMVSDWQGWGQLVEPVQTGGLLELFCPFVGVCVRGVAVFKVT